MTHYDFIIVGQGLAGTAVAWHLLWRGCSVLIVDREPAVTASRIAAGLLTPVTGKRLARSWRWETLAPAAEEFYRAVEAVTGRSFFRRTPAIRFFADEAERAEFAKRMAATDDQPRAPSIRGLAEPLSDVPDGFDAPLGGFVMPDAGRLDVPAYLDASRDYFASRGAYQRLELDATRDLEETASDVRLPRWGLRADTVIFCTGYNPAGDAVFGTLPFNAAKGEILTLRIKDLGETRTIHQGIWLAPTGGGLYRCGATYTWEPLDCRPTEAGRTELEDRLRRFLRVGYDVIGHQAAVRPVIDAGYPVLGRHPRRPRLACLNGLGSKGSLLAPFFARQLVETLLDARRPEPRLDLRRYLDRR